MSQDITRIHFRGVNCYLVKTSDDGYLLIDTGFAQNRADIAQSLESAGCKPGNLTLILVTHGDADHVGNCAYLREKYGSRIAMHRDEQDAVVRGNPALNKNIGHTFLGIMIRLLLRFFTLNKADRFQPDILIVEGTDLREYGFDAQVVYLPGHSNGSIGILTADGDLFCGDLLRNARKPAPGLGMFDQMGWHDSLEKLKQLPITTVYPGHGKPFPIASFLSTLEQRR
jgi:hydroxyacylglutathione hydrolase